MTPRPTAPPARPHPAADAAGDDKRGEPSAAIRVVGKEVYAIIDARMDAHAEPVTKLQRVGRPSPTVIADAIHAEAAVTACHVNAPDVVRQPKPAPHRRHRA